MKKIKVSAFILMLVGFLMISVNVKATSKVIIEVTVDGKSTVLESSDDTKIQLKYDMETKNLEVSDTKVLNETVKVGSSGARVEFKSKHLVDFAYAGGYSFESGSIVHLNEVVFDIVDYENIDIYHYGKPFYSDRYEMTAIFSFIDSKLAMTGNDVLLANVDKHYTIEEVKKIANIKANDTYDGDISHLIKVERNDYDLNKNKLGTFDIVFSVENSTSLKTEYTLKVLVRDYTKPQIEGNSELTYGYEENVTLDQIKSEYSVKDNYDTIIKLELIAPEFDAKKPGKYTMNLSAKDTSGNETKKDITVNIVDRIKPFFTDEHDGKVTVNFRDKITDEELLLGLLATDEIDGDLTNSIKITKNNLKQDLGKYTVEYEVKDLSGNIEVYSREYTVISTDAPKFFVSKDLLTIEEVNQMTLEQLAEILSKINNIDMKDYRVLKNEYEGNESQVGMYEVLLQIDDLYDNTYIVEQNIKVYSLTGNNSKKTSSDNYFLLSLLVIPISAAIYIGFKRRP